MLYSKVTPEQKRLRFRELLASGTVQQFPGAFNPLSARLIEEKGFAGVYISGAVLANDLGLPDIGLTTLTEVATRAGQIARMTDLPAIVDADTGFGEPMNVARTVQEIENAGLAGLHIEDQFNPKRCGHLDGKNVVDLETATKRIRAAADARRDPNFLIMARTDIRAVDGLAAAQDQARALVEAGADAIFPEAMKDLAEFQAIRDAVDVPILANMTEFGKSELFTVDQLQGVGVNMVIYPVTLLRSAMGAAERVLDTLKSLGTQQVRVPEMLTRARLYDLVNYEAYNKFDSGIFNFQVPTPANTRNCTKEFSMADIETKKGLAGVVVDYTAVSKVNPDTNSLLYRGYPVQELATKCSFEEVAYLLWNGELPTPGELAAFTEQERAGRALNPAVKQVVDALPVTAHPMDICRTAASVMGSRHPLAEDSTPEANMTKAIDLFSAMPAVVAYDQRRRRGQDLVEPRGDLGYSANFLWMTFGEEAVDEVIEAFTVSMILYAEHSFNASTFTARVVTSTLSDLHSAVTAAIGALKGPLHGGANEAVMHTFDEIGIRPEESLEEAAVRAKTWMEDALAQKKKIMGFGHRVYKHGDSRVPTMKAALDKMIAHYGRPELLGLYQGLETAMDETKAIKPNLDYPAGPTYHLMGFDTPTFTPIFVASRITGWTAHIMEQSAANSLIRPLSAYNGVEQRSL